MPSTPYRYLPVGSIARSVGDSWQKSALGVHAPTGITNGLPGTGVSAPFTLLMVNAATAPPPLVKEDAYKNCPSGSMASAGSPVPPGMAIGEPGTSFSEPLL